MSKKALLELKELEVTSFRTDLKGGNGEDVHQFEDAKSTHPKCKWRSNQTYPTM